MSFDGRNNIQLAINKEKYMRYSVIVPVYNVKSYLPCCIEKLKEQVYQDYEVVLVDDGSTDGSEKICDEIVKNDGRFRVIHKKNEGLISARRTGIKAAKGDYFLFCDSDDFYEPNTIQKVDSIIKATNADLVVFNAYIYNGKEKEDFSKPVFKDGIIEKKVFIKKMFDSYALNSMCMKAMKRTIVDIEKKYNLFYSCNFGEDLLQSMPVIINANTIYYTSNRLYNYRIASGMMRRYSSEYYWSYKKVNSEILKLLENAGVQDAKTEIMTHLLKVVYGNIIQSQFASKCPITEWEKIWKDPKYQEADSAFKSPKNRINLEYKEKIFLMLFRNKQYRILYYIVKIKKYITAKR